MIKKILLLGLTMIVLAFVVSCDRFEKPEISDNSGMEEAIGQVFLEFDTVADTTNSLNLDNLMAFFSEDYLNNGETKASFKQKILDNIDVDMYTHINIELLAKHGYDVTWKISINDEQETSLFSEQITDVVKLENENYVLYGNQHTPQDSDKMPIFAEIMTATWCGSCPYVEAAVHEYQENNLDDFFYLEFHYNDGLTADMEFFNSFYGFSSAPVGIIQGETVLQGDMSDSYEAAINQYKNQDAQFEFENFTQTADENNFIGSVDLTTLDTEAPTENLKLRWAFYETLSATNNANGAPCRHVVLTEGFINIDASQLDTTVDMNLSYPRSNADDIGIAIWLQTCGDTHDDTSKIHTWTKLEIGEL